MTPETRADEPEPSSPLRLWGNFAPLREIYEPVRLPAVTTDADVGLNPFAGLDAAPWITWGAVVVCLALIALLSVSQTYLLSAERGDEVSFGELAVWTLTEVVTWGALSPIILWLARTMRFRRPTWLRALAGQAVTGVAFAFVEPAVQIAVGALLFGAGTRGRSVAALYAFSCIRKFHLNLLLDWMIVVLSHGIDTYRRSRNRELRASQLEARLVQSRLEALKMQLHPHFLFNTLNSISALIDEDPRAASRMVARVGELLRMALESSGDQHASFGEELRFAKTYLEIERIRFEDRLTVRYDVDPDTLDAAVPSMLLQPIVENAIKHGVARREDDGLVEIAARRDGARLSISVRDNGPGVLATDAGADRGVGLANTRARLGNLYESGYSFELTNAPDGGAVVRLELPFDLHEERDPANPDRRNR